jgi:hypothetical protein
MPTGHYPFNHRGGMRMAIWNWPTRPRPQGWTDNWPGPSQYDGKFSNVLLDTQTGFNNPNRAYTLTGPANTQLPADWVESPGLGSFGLEPIYSPGRPSGFATLGFNNVGRIPNLLDTPQERILRRNIDHAFGFDFDIWLQGGAYQTVWPFAWVSFSVHWAFNRTIFPEPFADGNFRATTTFDATKTIVSDKIPTILRVGDETYREESINQSITGYRLFPYFFAKPNGNFRSGFAPDPAVEAYYNNMFNSLVGYLSSYTTLAFNVRMAATPFTYLQTGAEGRY